MNTYSQFVSAVAALEIAGVPTRFSYPPASVAKTPCSFPMLPTGQEGALTIGANGGWPAQRVDLVVLYQAVAQSDPQANFEGCLTTMEAVSAALRAARFSKLTWSMRQAVVTVAGVDYWAVVASVEGHG